MSLAGQSTAPTRRGGVWFRLRIEPRPKYEGKPEDHEAIAHHILNIVPIRTIQTEGVMYYYKDGRYRPGAEKVVETELHRDFRKVSRQFIDSVLNKIQANTSVFLSEIGGPYFDPDLNVINMRNGLFNWRTDEFKRHTPDYPSVVQIPIRYNPEAECPRIMKMLSEILKPEDVTKFLEFSAYCLYRAHPIQKMLLLFGPSGTGKSTLIKLLRHLVGEENCAEVPIHKMYKEFAVATMRGKLLNAVSDLSSRDIRELAEFKKLTSGRDIVGARHLYEDYFVFVNYAKTVVSR
ncbi:MAG TPA: phage/plasmid primase, P4 family [Methanothrix sp.]|nr:phage/plasmid primase, P4 family [Methanothrix sp.]HOK59244.1 phage/plasmid primase, P4 family [Methanothrix sp.]HOL44759.1 phage/plasmid primase, P4 family [Methanothrix sp.]